MKVLIKRYGWHILLFLNIYCISIFLIEMFQMYRTVNRVGMQTVDGLSDQSIQFMIDAQALLDFSFLQEETAEFALMQRLSDDMPVYCVVYANSYFQVEEGRSFEQADFEKGQPILICGTNAGDIVTMDPFLLGDIEYHKIGTLYNTHTLASEYGVFLTQGSIVNNSVNREYILEGLDRRSTEQIFSEIESWAEKQGYTAQKLSRQESRINDIYHVDDISLAIVTLSLLVLGSSLVLIVYFWLCQYRELERVYFLTGMRRFRSKVCFDYTLLLLSGYLGALFTSGNYSLSMTETVFFVLYLGMMLILILCFAIYRKEEHEKNMGRNLI